MFPVPFLLLCLFNWISQIKLLQGAQLYKSALRFSIARYFPNRLQQESIYRLIN